MSALYDFYNTDLQPALLQQERRRKLILWATKFILVFMLLSSVVGILRSFREIGFEYISQILIGSLLLNVPILIIVFITRFYVLKIHRQSFKQKVISKLSSYVDDGLNYSAKEAIAVSDIDQSTFFPNFVEINGQDLFEGSFEDLCFRCSEISVRNELRNRSKYFSNGEDAFKSFIFKGLFVEVDLATSIDCQAYIFPNNVKEIVSKHLRTLKGIERVHLEDPTFERYFNVYASDQIKSRVLLTTRCIENIVKLRRKMDANFMLSIQNNKLFLAIPDMQNSFNVDVSRSYLNPDHIKRSVKKIQCIKQIIIDLHKVLEFEIDLSDLAIGEALELDNTLPPRIQSKSVNNLKRFINL